MCLLKLNFSSITRTIPNYFIVDTWFEGLLFKYMLVSLLSLLFLLDIIITLELPSLKLMLLFPDQAVILLISMFELFSAALTVSFLMANIESSANATALELFVNWMFSREFYWIFQYPDRKWINVGNVLCMLILLDERPAVCWMK